MSSRSTRRKSVLHARATMSSPSTSSTTRARGGYRQRELYTIPTDVSEVHGRPQALEVPIRVLTNFVAVSPLQDREVFQYRVEFEPDVESVSLRRSLFRELASNRLDYKYTFDGMHDLLSGFKLVDEATHFSKPDPRDSTKQVLMTIKHVGVIGSGLELLRIYNMNMKACLRDLGYFSVSQAGAYVHPDLATQIGNTGIAVLRGFKTSANVHEKGTMLMNLESVHKIMQQRNVLQVMSEFRGNPNVREILKSQLTGKLVITNYNKVVYKIEDVDFRLSPQSTFYDDRKEKDVSYLEYYQTRYDVRIKDVKQPLLLVIPNNNRKKGDEEQLEKSIYLVPELCNIAGLTDQQRNDSRLKVDLIRSSQISPADRVAHLNTFLKQLHQDRDIAIRLSKWGYTYEKEPVKIEARILRTEQIGVGAGASGPATNWPKVDNMGSFETQIMKERLAGAPTPFKMAVVISRPDAGSEVEIVDKLREGFKKIGLAPNQVEMVRIREGDSAFHYVQSIRNLSDDVRLALVILSRQNKERYDAVKKLATVERGLITQVVTAKLMNDERKARGAAIKIGIQVAAKLGGEPWYVNIPLGCAMICGYDTYRDAAKKGRSYGAFLASMNRRYSQWFSRVDMHDHLDELSAHLVDNLVCSMNKFKEINGRFPEKVFIYRDGVSDGQLNHVYDTELKQLRDAIKNTNADTRFTFIVVNKRIGARFYMLNNNTYINPPPGSVIDDVVTRKERYDFYLISQSTRNGTVTPTYYNIMHDDTGFDASKQQQLAYKLCFLYYNWTGTVRVPAPCQYAHKLAFLCGEHLHNVPNISLENNLHFL